MALVNVINRDDLKGWVNFIFQMTYSGFISWAYGFGTASGTALSAHLSFSLALGTGLAAGALSGASAMSVVWLRSPLTKGLALAVPKEMDSQSPEVQTVAHTR